MGEGGIQLEHHRHDVGEKCLASTIQNPVHVSGLYKSLYNTAHVPRIPIYTLAKSYPD